MFLARCVLLLFISATALPGQSAAIPQEPVGPEIVITFHVFNSKTGKPMDARFFQLGCWTDSGEKACPYPHLESAQEVRHGLVKIQVPERSSIFAYTPRYISFCSCHEDLDEPLTRGPVEARKIEREGLVFNHHCEEGMPPGAAAIVPKPGEVTIFYRRLSLYERIYANMW